MGISPRRLHGWEPGEVTEFEYDDSGRLVRAVTLREPEFSAKDLASLLTSRSQALAPRGSHGVLISEATDPKNRGKFLVDLPMTDYAAQVLDNAQKAYEGKYGKDSLHNKLWRVRLPE